MALGQASGNTEQRQQAPFATFAAVFAIFAVKSFFPQRLQSSRPDSRQRFGEGTERVSPEQAAQPSFVRGDGRRDRERRVRRR
jgi:hypothetical protein